MTAIIIDDLPLARASLAQVITQHTPFVEIIGEASGVLEGIKLIKKLKPELVFLDIEMNDGSGFDLLELLDNIDFKIIFVTASDAHAIKACQYCGISYILKPVDADDVILAINRYDKIVKNEKVKYELLSTNLQNKNVALHQLALNSQEKINVVKIDQIIRCESEKNYTRFYTINNEKFLVSTNLGEYEKLLQEHNFVRVHTSHLVNLNFVKEFIKIDNELILTNKERISVSDRKRSEVMEKLGIK
jgi:two-component system, LytTR family, response regulator